MNGEVKTVEDATWYVNKFWAFEEARSGKRFPPPSDQTKRQQLFPFIRLTDIMVTPKFMEAWIKSLGLGEKDVSG